MPRIGREAEGRPPSCCPAPLVTARHPALPAGEAGSVWRSEKLRDFVFRLRCLGLEGDPQYAALVEQIAKETEALEALADRQRQPDYHRPWWQDGEYDSVRADR